MPAVDVPWPFTITSFTSNLVLGYGQTTGTVQIRDEMFEGTVKYAGTGGVLAFEYAFLDHFSARALINELVYSGINGKSALAVGTELRLGFGAGATASLPIGDTARAGFLFDFISNPSLALTVASGFRAFADSCSQPSGCKVSLSQILGSGNVLTIQPALAASWAPFRTLGLTANVAYQHFSSSGAGAMSGDAVNLAVAADYDFGARSSVPVGIAAAVRLGLSGRRSRGPARDRSRRRDLLHGPEGSRGGIPAHLPAVRGDSGARRELEHLHHDRGPSLLLVAGRGAEPIVGALGRAQIRRRGRPPGRSPRCPRSAAMTSCAPMRALLARLRLGGDRYGTRAGVVGLLAVFAAFAVAGSRHDSVTVDEFAIVPSGYAKWIHPGMANWLNPANPPLGQLAVALPLLARGARLPEPWLGAEVPELRWTLGQWFMRENWESYLGLFESARAVSIAFGLALCLLVFLWSREAFGRAGSWISLVLCATCPNLLAHGHLATVDMAFTLACFGSTYALWRLLRSDRDRLLQEWTPYAVGVAAALNVKFTFLLLVPLHLGLALLAGARQPRRRMRLLGGFAAVAAFALVVTGALYGFEGVGTRVERLAFGSQRMRALQATVLGALPSPLPEWYLRGLDYETVRGERRLNQFYMLGEVYDEPRPEYFGFALLLKTPLPHLLLVVAAIAAVLHLLWPRGDDARRARENALHLFVPAVWILVAFSFLVGVNLGVRHVLPVLPFFYALAGVLGPLCARKTLRAAVIALMAAAGLAAVSSAPRFVSSFNVLAGGNQGGYRFLSDSNLDWGQDLRDLRATMDRLGLRRVTLSYFGLVDPALYGIEASGPEAMAERGGVVAISVHHLNGITPFAPQPLDLLDRLRDEPPLARAGDSIFLFRVPSLDRRRDAR
jgi:hypothetical protein